MYRIFSLLIMSLMTFAYTLADDYVIDGIQYIIRGENTAAVKRLIKRSEASQIVVSIPEYVLIEEQEYEVTAILENAFSGINWMQEVIIPNTIIDVGDYAFSKCAFLNSITVGNGVNHFGDNAFYDCSRLDKVVVSDLDAWFNIDFGNTFRMGNMSAKSDLNYRIKANPLGYAHNFYIGEEEITNLIIPENITKIKDCTFVGANFTNIQFHDEVIHIGEAAFLNCSYIESLVLPDKITSIGESSFGQIESLTNVHFGKDFHTVGINAFNGTNNIEEIFSENPTPPNIMFSGSYFLGFNDKVFRNAIVYVPLGSLEAYRDNYIWNKFVNIVEFDFNSILDIENDHDNNPIYININGIRIEKPNCESRTKKTNNKSVYIVF